MGCRVGRQALPTRGWPSAVPGFQWLLGIGEQAGKEICFGSGAPRMTQTQQKSLQQPAPPARLHSLDLLRIIGAVGVVVHHWPYFFFSAAKGATAYDVTRLPLAPILSLFYRRGMLFVDLFLCLSGFVFYWLYAERIHLRRIPLRDFVVLRVSRLYPLHLLTLGWVAVGQVVFRLLTGTYFVYRHNDVYHFILNLFLASS